MPRKPIDYSKTVIYELCCKDPNIKLTYVGSTTNFPNRKSKHKCDCKNPKSENHNLKVYQTIRENGGWDNFEMIMLEKYPCKDKIESDARERYWLEKLSASLNSVVPGRKQNERNYLNKKICSCGSEIVGGHDKRHEETKQHQHWLKTGEHKVVKGEQYTCGCGSTLSKNHKARHETSKGHQKWLASSSSKNDKN